MVNGGLEVKKRWFFSSYVSALLNKKSKSEILTPKFKSIESIWTVLAGSCKKSPNKSKLWFFLLDKSWRYLKIFRRWSCLRNFDRRRFPYKSNFFHYFSNIIYECANLKMSTSAKSRLLSRVPLKAIDKCKICHFVCHRLAWIKSYELTEFWIVW